jgi:hypothetical protein
LIANGSAPFAVDAERAEMERLRGLLGTAITQRIAHPWVDNAGAVASDRLTLIAQGTVTAAVPAANGVVALDAIVEAENLTQFTTRRTTFDNRMVDLRRLDNNLNYALENLTNHVETLNGRAATVSTLAAIGVTVTEITDVAGANTVAPLAALVIAGDAPANQRAQFVADVQALVVPVADVYRDAVTHMTSIVTGHALGTLAILNEVRAHFPILTAHGTDRANFLASQASLLEDIATWEAAWGLTSTTIGVELEERLNDRAEAVLNLWNRTTTTDAADLAVGDDIRTIDGFSTSAITNAAEDATTEEIIAAIVAEQRSTLLSGGNFSAFEAGYPVMVATASTRPVVEIATRSINVSVSGNTVEVSFNRLVASTDPAVADTIARIAMERTLTEVAPAIRPDDTAANAIVQNVQRTYVNGVLAQVIMPMLGGYILTINVIAIPAA